MNQVIRVQKACVFELERTINREGDQDYWPFSIQSYLDYLELALL